MTINEYRKHLGLNAINIYGIEWNFIEDDLVRIIASNDIYEIKFKNFINLGNSLGLSDKFKEQEITDLKIVKDERLPHVMVLLIDVRPKESKEKAEGGITARMKFM